MKKRHLFENHYFLLLLVVVLSLFPIFLRFEDSAQIGIFGSDSFWYWETAVKWLTGDFHVERHYRPLAHILNAFGLKVFGVNDYALKYVSAILDVINVIFIFLLSTRYLKNKLFIVLLPICYAFHGQAIEMSHHELVHIGTMTFLLGSLYFLFKYIDGYHDKFPRYSLFLSGLFLSLSGHMHPEVFAHSFFFILFIIIKNLRNGFSYKSKKTKIELAYWLSGFLSVFVFFFVIIGLFTIVGSLISGASFQHGTKIPRTVTDSILRIFEGQYVYLNGIGSWGYACVVYIILFFNINKLIKRKRIDQKTFFLAVLFFAQLSLCLILISRNLLPRILYPFLPLSLLVIYNFFEKIKHKLVMNSIGVLFAFLFIFQNGFSTKNEMDVSYFKKYSDIIKKNSTTGSVLIGPVLYYSVGHGYNFKLHLGKRAIYIYHKAKDILFVNPEYDIPNYFKERNIRYYIYGKKNIDRRMIEDPLKIKKTKKVLNNFYNIKIEDFSEDQEREMWKRILVSLKAKVLYEDDGAIIYEF